MKVKKEVKVGFIVLLSIGLLFWGANFLKGKDVFSKEIKLYGVYPRVDGLGVSNPVIINGFKIGRVTKIYFDPKMNGDLIVQFSIDNTDFEVPSDTRAKIVSADILGSKSIELVLGTSLTYVQNGDTLNSDIEASLSEEVNQQILPLKRKAEDLIQTVDSAIMVVSAIFNKDARNDLNQSFGSIKRSLLTFEMTAKRIDDMIREEKEHFSAIFANVESISTNLKNNNENLSEAISNINQISDSLAQSNLKQTINNAALAMESASIVLKQIENGEGTVGQLLNNDTLYTNLEAAAKDLDKLFLDLRLNPERYVHFSIFGRKNKDKD
ncbi:MlaD family protein [Acidiluteibacter ferrifornacis]|uniref:MCE family protein n=1 Tax=Acidiluteibacter ferrifornacis TaxID=2692424 RepID=A0A6N9NK78_9FLAO|nr:MlaD family protein [Acidiluteibacter ferrifornacis]MBR9833076.1 MCE family protein [bacterium]NBG66274.1 MCE family protein [Acidiluteibacter ferrifornacis]